MIVHVTDIGWDTDDEDVDLPEEFDIEIDADDLDPNDPEDDDEFGERVSDAISDTYGFCHKRFCFTIK